MSPVRPLLAFVLLLLAATPPTLAHENHLRERIEEAGKAGTPGSNTPGAMEEAMEEHVEAMEEAAGANRSWPDRLISWMGRTHPFAVHFPIALFPIAWIALLFVRRRGETTTLIRALVIVAGGAAGIAAILGWLDAGFLLADRDPIQAWHRWIGTALGAIGAAVALWAWRRASALNTSLMVWALGSVTLLLLIQGWFGAALVHGAGHMNF